jgi:hypothetical protein
MEHSKSKQPVSYKDGVKDESSQVEVADAVLEAHEGMHPSASSVFVLIYRRPWNIWQSDVLGATVV